MRPTPSQKQIARRGSIIEMWQGENPYDPAGYTRVEYTIRGSGTIRSSHNLRVIADFEEVSLSCPNPLDDDAHPIDLTLWLPSHSSLPDSVEIHHFTLSLIHISMCNCDLGCLLYREFEPPRPLGGRFLDCFPTRFARATDPRLENYLGASYQYPPLHETLHLRTPREVEELLRMIDACPHQQSKELGNVVFALSREKQRPEIVILRAEDMIAIDPEFRPVRNYDPQWIKDRADLWDRMRASRGSV